MDTAGSSRQGYYLPAAEYETAGGSGQYKCTSLSAAQHDNPLLQCLDAKGKYPAAGLVAGSAFDRGAGCHLPSVKAVYAQASAVAEACRMRNERI